MKKRNETNYIDLYYEWKIMNDEDFKNNKNNYLYVQNKMSVIA